MNHPDDEITEADLQAYLDDELPVVRRIEIEAHLSSHPAIAARVMADLRSRDELRLALCVMPRAGQPATGNAARRLERGLAMDRFFRRARKVATVAALLCVGWLAHDRVGPLGIAEVSASALPPAYVADAVQAHRTALVRTAMHSQRPASDFDRSEIRAATAIVVPSLPDGWEVADVQIFPSAFGPSVEITAHTQAFGTVSLFAVRPGTFDVVKATLAHKDDLTAAYWQIGEVAYALVAKGDARELDTAAARLAASLY